MGQSLERSQPLRLRLRPRTHGHFVSGLLAPAACRRTLFGKAAEKHRQVACAPRNPITPVTMSLAGKGAASRSQMPKIPDPVCFSRFSRDADRISPSVI